jgi:hypothetical protein
LSQNHKELEQRLVVAESKGVRAKIGCLRIIRSLSKDWLSQNHKELEQRLVVSES